MTKVATFFSDLLPYCKEKIKNFIALRILVDPDQRICKSTPLILYFLNSNFSYSTLCTKWQSGRLGGQENQPNPQKTGKKFGLRSIPDN